MRGRGKARVMTYIPFGRAAAGGHAWGHQSLRRIADDVVWWLLGLVAARRWPGLLLWMWLVNVVAGSVNHDACIEEARPQIQPLKSSISNRRASLSDARRSPRIPPHACLFGHALIPLSFPTTDKTKRPPQPHQRSQCRPGLSLPPPDPSSQQASYAAVRPPARPPRALPPRLQPRHQRAVAASGGPTPPCGLVSQPIVRRLAHEFVCFCRWGGEVGWTVGVRLLLPDIDV